MIQHILFPTDGSDGSHQALPYLISLAHQYQAKITLLHTYDFAMEHIMSRYGTETTVLQTLDKRISETGDLILSTLKQELENEGLNVHAVFNEKGDAGQWIVRTAEREHCSLILMGTRGLGTLKSVLLGSTSHFVVNHSHKTPVFLIPVT